MIYVFSFTILYTFVQQRNKLLSSKRNLILYLFLSMLGIVLGIIYMINPYLPSISLLLEKYIK